MSKLLMFRLAILSFIESKLKIVKSSKPTYNKRKLKRRNKRLLFRLNILKKVRSRLRSLIFKNRAELYASYMTKYSDEYKD